MHVSKDISSAAEKQASLSLFECGSVGCRKKYPRNSLFELTSNMYIYNINNRKKLYIPNKNTNFAKGFSLNRAIQACYSTSKDINTFEREVKALVELDKVHPLDRRVIVTYDEDRIIKAAGGKDIEIIPAWKWLLR